VASENKKAVNKWGWLQLTCVLCPSVGSSGQGGFNEMCKVNQVS